MNDHRVIPPLSSLPQRLSTRVAAFLTVGLCAVVLAAPACAEAPQGDWIEASFFSPELVMQHQGTIGLSKTQQRTLVTEVQAVQSEIVPLQFEFSEATERLANLVAATKIDESQAMAQVDILMMLDSQIKTLHLKLLVRTKNLLSAQQQERLRALRGR